MSQPRILLVEDEAIARQVLQVLLGQAGYEVISVGSGEEAIEQLDTASFDVVVTDLQLRRLDGVAVMAHARACDPEVEVIVLTGYANVSSAIAAVRHGASNYILKPGSSGEIERSVAEALKRRQERLARSDWLRRMGHGLLQLADTRHRSAAATVAEPVTEKILRVGALVIDLQRHVVTLAERDLQLSSGEFSLLAYLAQHREQVVSPQQILRELDGYSCSPQDARNMIKSRIWSLRRKIEDDPANPQLIVSVRGVGYVLTDGQRRRG